MDFKYKYKYKYCLYSFSRNNGSLNTIKKWINNMPLFILNIGCIICLIKKDKCSVGDPGDSSPIAVNNRNFSIGELYGKS